MEDLQQKDGGEPKDPIDAYDAKLGKPQEKDYRANPPAATADTEHPCYRVGK